jgi:peptidoglycan/LPS O-acetylase OafA/YrhL
MNAPPDHRPELDGIRGIAIFSVVFWHYLYKYLPEGQPPIHVLRTWVSSLLHFRAAPEAATNALGLFRLAISPGWSGVDLFFVLSGFLIGGILIDKRTSPSYFKTFYIRRAARILPLYVLLLAVASFFLFAPPNSPASLLMLSPHPAWPYLTFTQNFMIPLLGWGPMLLTPTWSLAVEEQFYLFLPALVRRVPGRAIPWACAGLGLIALVSRSICAIWFPHAIGASRVLTICRLDSLMLGVLCAWAIRHEGARAILLNNHRTIRALSAASIAILVYMTIWNTAGRYVQMEIFGYLLFAIVYAAFLLMAYLRPESPEAWITRLPFFKRLGILAYGIYLFHSAVLFSLNTLILAKPETLSWITPIAAVLTYVLASLSWRFFEKPIVTWGHRFRY